MANAGHKSCARCGASMAATSRFCSRCGATRTLQTTGGQIGHGPSGSSAGWTGLSGAVTVNSPRAAGFWIRVASFLVDLAILVVPVLLIRDVVPLVGPLTTWWLYFAVSESSRWQGTVGKRLLRIRVTDVNGVQLRFGRSTARFFARFLSTLPLGAGYAMVALNANKQALHDFVASTRVVYR